MKKKTLLIMGIALIIALLSTACGKSQNTNTTQTTTSIVATTTTTTTTTAHTTAVVPTSTTVTTATSNPTYGGTITFSAARSFTVWDPAGAPSFMQVYLSMFDPIVAADMTKTPMGNGEWNYMATYIPQQYLAPYLIESFEQPDISTVIWHLRQGIHYQNKAPANGREMIASDVVYCINRIQADVRSTWYKADKTQLITATTVDKYTVQLKLGIPSVEGFRTSVQVYPPEVVTQYGNLEDWHNLCGTGPWVVTDCVPDSSLTYAKNPDYWRYDENHPGNRLPYLDGYRYIIIPDTQTNLAALRTDKLTMYTVALTDAQTVWANSPNLKWISRIQQSNNMINYRLDLAPYSDIRVRKALAMAIDRQSIIDGYFQGHAKILEWPYLDSMSDVYTPLDQLPADVQEAYQFNPIKAKALLTEAGFPNGFSQEVIVPNNSQLMTDMVSLVKSYWDAIGVKTTINTGDANSVMPQLWVASYKNVAANGSWGNTSPWSVNTAAYRGKIKYSSKFNYSNVNDDYLDSWTDKLLANTDPVSRTQGLKDQGVYELQQLYAFQLPCPENFTFFQPYLINYHGEIGSWGERVWIDQNLKQQMTGK